MEDDKLELDSAIKEMFEQSWSELDVENIDDVTFPLAVASRDFYTGMIHATLSYLKHKSKR